MNLKIGVTFHKPYPICDAIKNTQIYNYIHAGRELYQGNDEFLLNIQGDNTGKNISKYNPYINECTSLYWMYYNMPDYDYYGHFQYHRFLQYDMNDLNENTILVSDVIFNLTNFNIYCFFNFDKKLPDLFNEFIFDYINKHEQERDLLIDFLTNQYDWFRFNIFIMPKQVWNEYGKWLTDIIEQTALPLINNNIHKCYDPRYYGYILELMNGYFNYKKSLQGFIIKRCSTIFEPY